MAQNLGESSGSSKAFSETSGLTRRSLLGIGAAASIWNLAGIGQSTWAASGTDITHGSRNIPKIALTFHGAGDPKIAQEIIDIFTSHKTLITVFGVGNWLEKNPDLVNQMQKAKFDLGNHTYSHQAMKTLGAKQTYLEIQKCAKVLTSQIGYSGKWFRPSGTQYSNALIRKNARNFGYQHCISYDVDSLDYTDPASSKIEENVRKSIKPGSIVSLHFGHNNTPKALPKILKNIEDQGLKPVTISELLVPLKISPSHKVIK